MPRKIENKLLKKTDDLIWEKREYIAEYLGCKPLFGVVGGSISLNMANPSSDIDFYLVTEMQINNNILQTVQWDDVKVDFMCVEFKDLLDECTKYFEKQRQYPTRFYRSQSEESRIILANDVERPDFKREMIMRIFLAEEILEFKSGSVENAHRKLGEALKLIDIWDYHFNRAYGNYYEKIKGKEKVPLRKYLHIISEICACHKILNEDEVIMNYKQVVEYVECLCNDVEISRLCARLWEENNKAMGAKNKNLICAEPMLNEWIEENLDVLLCHMRKKEKFLREKMYVYNPSKIRYLG